jgi:YVTN family beta-propeller protein
VDASGRGVSGGSVTWSVQPAGHSTISPGSGSGDLGGRFDAQWQFTTFAGTHIATASGAGTPGIYVADVQPGLTTAVAWTLLSSPASQGTVTGPKAITFTSTNRRGVIVTHAHDADNNPTQPSLCAAAPGQVCQFPFPPYAELDSTHTSGGVNGDTIFFHVNVTTPSPFVFRGVYSTAAGQTSDSVIVTMNAQAAGVKIDRDPFSFGVQASPDTASITSLCPSGPGNFSCQGTYSAFVVDSALTPIGNANALFTWTLVPPTGSPITLDSVRGSSAQDIAFVTARANGFVRLVVKDGATFQFGSDTLPVLVTQLPGTIHVTPDTISALVGSTTTFRAVVLDQGGDTMPAAVVHWRLDNPSNPHITIVDTATVNQVKVRLDSTPFGGEAVDALTARAPGDTVFGFGQVLNPVTVRLTVAQQPWAIAVNSQTHAVYAGHQGGQIYRVNGTTDVVVDSVSAGQFVSSVAVNSVTNRVFVGMDAGVRVLDGATLGTVTTVATGTTQRGVTNRQGLTVDSVNNRIYVTVDIGSVAAAPVLRRIDGSNNTSSATNDVPLPDLGTGAAFNPANGLVYVAIPDSDMVLAVDPVAKTFVRIPVGSFPIAVAVDPVTNRIYALDQNSEDVAVIDGASQSVITTVPLFAIVTGIGVDPVNNRIYVGVSSVNELLVIDGNTNTFQNTVFLGPFGDEVFGVVFDAGNKKVWTANYSSASVSRVEY